MLEKKEREGRSQLSSFSLFSGGGKRGRHCSSSSMKRMTTMMMIDDVGAWRTRTGLWCHVFLQIEISFPSFCFSISLIFLFLFRMVLAYGWDEVGFSWNGIGFCKGLTIAGDGALG